MFYVGSLEQMNYWFGIKITHILRLQSTDTLQVLVDTNQYFGASADTSSISGILSQNHSSTLQILEYVEKARDSLVRKFPLAQLSVERLFFERSVRGVL